MTRVKICGFRESTPLFTAVQEGVHAVGFVFYEASPRFIHPDEVRRLCFDLPPFVSKVGVFVNQSLKDILDIAFSTGLDTIQLHSETYTEDAISALKTQWPFSIIKAIRCPVLDDTIIEKNRKSGANALLFDAWHPTEYGGTGQKLSFALSSTSHQWLRTKAIIAGGISIENLASVLSLRPYGIDISSGVEITKGVKDPTLIKNFLRHFYDLASEISEA